MRRPDWLVGILLTVVATGCLATSTTTAPSGTAPAAITPVAPEPTPPPAPPVLEVAQPEPVSEAVQPAAPAGIEPAPGPPPPAPTLGTSSPTGRNPKLLWSPAKQTRLARMRAEGHPWWKIIKDSAELSGTATPRYADLGQWATMAYQVTGDARYAEKAWAQASKKLKGTAKPDSSRNFTREHFIEFAIMYDWLRPALTEAQRAKWIESLNYWTDLCRGKVSGVAWGTRAGDSDETTGQTLGMLLWRTASYDDNPAIRTLNEQDDIKKLVMAVQRFQRLAADGVWIESTQYNLGTMRLFLVGAAGLGWDLADFVERAQQAEMAAVTPDLKASFQWGDVENPRNLMLDRRLPLLWTLYGLAPDPVFAGFAKALQAKKPDEVRWWHLLFGDPYAPVDASWQSKRTARLAVRSQGQVLVSEGGGLFAFHVQPWNGVDHAVAAASDVQLYRKGEWAITHPIGYDASRGEHYNAGLLEGLSAMREARGLVHVELRPGLAIAVGVTAGHVYPKDYYKPPPRFTREWTRAVAYAADGRADVVVLVDRFDVVPVADSAKFRPEDRPKVDGQPPAQLTLHAPSAPTLNGQTFSWRTAGGQMLKGWTLGTRCRYSVQADAGLAGTLRDSEKQGQALRIEPENFDGYAVLVHVLAAGEPDGVRPILFGNKLTIERDGAATLRFKIDLGQRPAPALPGDVSSKAVFDATLLTKAGPGAATLMEE